MKSARTRSFRWFLSDRGLAGPPTTAVGPALSPPSVSHPSTTQCRVRGCATRRGTLTPVGRSPPPLNPHHRDGRPAVRYHHRVTTPYRKSGSIFSSNILLTDFYSPTLLLHTISKTTTLCTTVIAAVATCLLLLLQRQQALLHYCSTPAIGLNIITIMNGGHVSFPPTFKKVRISFLPEIIIYQIYNLKYITILFLML